MGLSLRRIRFVVLAVLVAGSFVSACSDEEAASGAVGTAGQSQSIVVTASTRGVSVENRAGRPVNDVQVAIRPVGGGPDFLQKVSTMDTGERKELALSEFRTSDKVSLNPMFIRPQQVTVTARDDQGTNYQVTVPWK